MGASSLLEKDQGKINSCIPLILGVAFLLACGSSAPPPAGPEDEEDDLYESLVGPVEIDDEDEDEDEQDDEDDISPEEYTGPTELTINLIVVDQRNPKGTYKLSRADGTVVIEKGKFGEPVEVNQGVYSVEFKTPVVFGKPVYLAEDVEVVGKKMTHKQIFPAGQITLFTYRGNKKNKCIPVTFSVRSETLEQDLPGKGKTCEPLILETGAYEVLLNTGKKTIQPVKMRVNAEQVATAPIKLER